MGGKTAIAEREERAQFTALDDAAAVRPVAPAPTLQPAASAAKRAGGGGSALRRLRAIPAEDMAAEWARGTAFLWLPILLGSGALTYFALPVEPSIRAVLSGMACIGLFALLARDRFRLRLALLAALVFLLGMTAGKFETWRAGTPMVGSDVTTRVTGRLVSLEHRADGRFRLTIDLTGTERPRLRYPPDRVRLVARGVPSALAPGDGVTGLARLMSPSGPVRPQSYDFSFQSYFDGIGAVGFFMRDPERAALPPNALVQSRLRAWLQTARERLAGRLRARIDGPNGEIAAALVTGMRAGIPDEVNEALRRAGLAHVLAISGLHMALVAFVVIGTARFGFAFFPAFSSRHPVRKYAAAVALGICFLYLLISGVGVAAQRSFIMLAVMLAALLFDRAALTMRNLAIAALVVIAVSPHEAVGPGFQMSFAATAALIAGYAAWNGWRERRLADRAFRPPASRTRRVLRLAILYVGGLALTSLIAGTATALYGVWHFQRASPLALGANLAAMPVVSLLVMPSAVLAVLSIPFDLDWIPLKATDHGISAVVSIAKWFSERTPLDATGLIPLSATLALTVALMFLTLTTTRLKLLGLPFLLCGAILLAKRDLPDVLVSEDARLVAMKTDDGRLAVSRARPNGFTIENWLRAMRSDAFHKPGQGGESWPATPAGEQRFQCREKACIARHASGAAVVHLHEMPSDAAGLERAFIEELCRAARILVVNDATVGNPCAAGGARVITSRDLARRGSAAIYLDEAADGRSTEHAVFAIHEPWRPWHAHRQYSRAARGLGPYRKRD